MDTNARFSPLTIIAIIVMMAIFFAPPRSSLSPKEADRLLLTLGLKRTGTTSPVVMFIRPGCGPCDQLKGDLQARGVQFLCVDVSQTKVGNDALRELGKNTFGMTTSMPTPTTLVGTRIIRGSNTDGVLRALSGG